MPEAEDPLDRLQRLHTACHCCQRALLIVKTGCRVVFPQGEALIVDVDRCRAVAQQETRPDLIALHRAAPGGPLRWYVIEIKTRTKDVSKIVDQLQN